MIDHQRRIQWRANSQVALIALIMVGVFLVVLPVVGPMLYESYVLRLPLGYLLASVGGVVGLVGLIYWVAARQDRLDARFNITGEY